ncbi:MAG TPA: DMT family transporter [Candidatus Dormibacteraeota bacterium]|nr:DMT family transporter [Candidatus Dormibacteraeota bacterium]
MDRHDYLLLAFLAGLWGASFLFIKIAVHDIPPISMVFLRTLAAAAGIAVYMRATGVSVRGAFRKWKPGLFIAVLNAALPYVLIATSEKYIDSSLAGILNATAPIWTALLAPAFAEAEQFHAKQGIGLALGFVGVVILAHPTGNIFNSNFLSTLAVLAATLSYAVATHYSRRHFQDVSPTVPAFLQCALAALLLAPLAAFVHPDHVPPIGAVAATLWLGLGATGLAMVISFRLIQRVGAGRTIVVTYLLPPSALFYGYVFLHERPAPAVLLALVLILGGVFFITGRRGSHTATVVNDAAVVEV